MPDRTCSIDDCARPVLCRGLCNVHYHRLRRFGDPLVTTSRSVRPPCSIDGCEVISRARGYCSRHYKQWQVSGDPSRPVCAVDGCETTALARGWCEMHYQRWQKWGDPTTIYARPVCSVDGCDELSRSRGLCDRHHQRWRKYGDPLGHRPTMIGCSIDGCHREHDGHGWCSMHRMRWQKYGDPNAVRVRIGHVSRGYRIFGWKDHPLAKSNGMVFEHRVVLWDDIGPGVHPCHWCGRPVDWAKSYPKDRDALVVDHLDNNTRNNDLSNLVPSCNPCNTSKARQRR